MGNMLEFLFGDGVFDNVDEIPERPQFTKPKKAAEPSANSELPLYYVYPGIHESQVTSAEWKQLRAGVPRDEVFAPRFVKREVKSAVRMELLGTAADIGKVRYREMLNYDHKRNMTMALFRQRVSNESQDRFAQACLPKNFTGNRQERMRSMERITTLQTSRIGGRPVIYALAAGRELIFGLPDDQPAICE